MLRIISTLLFLLFVQGLSAQGTSVQFDIKGAPAGTYKVIGMLGGQNYLLDSLVYRGSGPIVWERKEAAWGGMYYFVFPDGQTFLQLLLDKDQTFTVRADRGDLIGSAKFDGCLDNQLFYESLTWETNFRKRLDSIDLALKQLPLGSPNQAYLENQKTKLIESRKGYVENLKVKHPDSFFTVFKVAGQNPDLKYPKMANGQLDTVKQVQIYRAEYWNGTNLADERLVRTPVVPNKLKTYMTQLIPQSPDSVIKYADLVIKQAKPCAECYKFVVNWIAIQFEKPSVMGGEAILVHLVDNYFTDEYAHWFADKPEELSKIRKRVNDMRPSLLGKQGQDLRCKGIDGQYKTLYDLKGAAKIVYMYSTSCSHCQERTPVLVDMLNNYWRAKGLEVYALCLDADEVKWKEFVQKYKMEGFVNVIDPKYESLYYKKYHVDITPELYILDANNKIIAKDLHPNQIESVLKKAFGIQ